MYRTLAAAMIMAASGFAGAAAAQTWGQPVYLNAWGRPVGGTPLSEVETRSYVETGRWADGYSERPYVYVPAPAWRSHRSYDGRGYRYQRRGHAYRPESGYRDEWGYSDDRPRSTRGWSNTRDRGRHDRDCGCGDVYFYDR